MKNIKYYLLAVVFFISFFFVQQNVSAIQLDNNLTIDEDYLEDGIITGKALPGDKINLYREQRKLINGNIQEERTLVQTADINELGEYTFTSGIDGPEKSYLELVRNDQPAKMYPLNYTDKSPLNLYIKETDIYKGDTEFEVSARKEAVINFYYNDILIKTGIVNNEFTKYKVKPVPLGANVKIEVVENEGYKETFETKAKSAIHYYKVCNGRYVSNLSTEVELCINQVAFSKRERPDVKIVLNDYKGNVLGKGNLKTDEYLLKIKIPKQKIGTKLYATAYDSDNEATEKLVINVLDGVPPKLKKLNQVYNSSSYISGTTDKEAMVYVRYNDDKYTGRILVKGKVDNKNNFNFKIKKQPAGRTLYISTVTKDKVYYSGDTKMIVKDNIPPQVPTVQNITSKTKTVKGKGEPNTLLYIYKGTKLIGSGQVNNDGNYFVKISTQKSKTKLLVSSVDAAGNESKEVKVTVK